MRLKTAALPVAALVLSAVIAALCPAVAAEGRIPVFAPGTVIGASGRYIVTQNIAGACGAPTITIAASGIDVDLDLNGFLVSNPAGCPSPVISISAGATGPDQVRIHDGYLSGGSNGIVALGAPLRTIVIEDVKTKTHVSQGIHITDATTTVIRRVEIVSASDGILIDGAGGKSGTIADSDVRFCANGIVLSAVQSFTVVNNRIQSIGVPPPPPAGSGFGILVTGGSAILLSENTIALASAEGIFLRACRTSKLWDNVIRGCGSHGIHLDPLTTDTLVLNNNSSGNGFGVPGVVGDGLLVEGSLAMIDHNQLNSNSRVGLNFQGAGGGPGCGNTFGRNTARGNLGIAITPCPGAPALFPPNSCNGAVGCGALPPSTFGDNLIPGPPVF